MLSIWASLIFLAGAAIVFASAVDDSLPGILFGMCLVLFGLGVLGSPKSLFYGRQGFTVKQRKCWFWSTNLELNKAHFYSLTVKKMAPSMGMTTSSDMYASTGPKKRVSLVAEGPDPIVIDEYLPGRWIGNDGIQSAKAYALKISEVTGLPVTVKVSF